MSRISTDPRIDPRLKLAFGAMPDAPDLGDVASRDVMLAEQQSDLAKQTYAAQTAMFAMMDTEEVAPSRGLRISTEQFVSSPDGNSIKVLFIRPDTSERVPCVCYLHGGAMQFWSAFDGLYRAWGRLIAAQGVAVALIDFRNALIPSTASEVAPFPAGLNDCVSGVKWVHASAAKLDIDASRIVVAGESGGGNLALATGLALLRDGDIGLVKGLYALSPYLAGRWPSAETPSSSENDGILLSLRNNRGAMAYGLEALEKRNPLAWPAFAGGGDVKGLPPTVIHVNECDPLRDEGINFYRLLVRNGVAARCRQIMGTVHGAELFAAVCPDVSRDAARDLAAFASDAPTARTPARAATYGFRAKMSARPGQGDALAEALLEAVKAGGPASNPDCVFFVVTRSAGNRDIVHVTEGWTTKEAHAENFARESSRAFTAKLAGLVDDAQYCDDVPAGGKFNL